MYVFRKSFIGLLAVALALSACSQTPEPELAGPPGTLAPQFGTPYSDEGNAVLVSRHTNAVYVGGGASDTDAFLRRYRPDGRLEWQKTFNAEAYNTLRDLAEDAQGNVFVAVEGLLRKYTSAGRELWRRTVTDVAGVSIAAVPTGESYLVGYDGNSRFLVRKYDPNGTVRWTKRFSNIGGSLTVTDAAGNLYVGGNTFFYKFDPTGKLVWTRTVPAGTADTVKIFDLEIVQDSLLLVGNKIWVLNDDEYDYEAESDVLVASFGLKGTQNWQRTFGTADDDSGGSIAVDNARNLYVTAYLSSDTSPTGTSSIIRKYSFTGQLLKQTAFPESLNGPNNANDGVFDIAAYRSDELYLTGRTTRNLGAGYAGGSTDAFLMRVDGQGNQVWVR